MTKRKADAQPEVVLVVGNLCSEVDPSIGTSQGGLAVEVHEPTGTIYEEGASADQTALGAATTEGINDLASLTFWNILMLSGYEPV